MKTQHKSNCTCIWFEELLYKYGSKIGANGIALYAYLFVSGKDESCLLLDVQIREALNMTAVDLLSAVRILKETKLIKTQRRGGKVLYTILPYPPQ